MAQHERALDAQAEGEAGVLVRVDAARREDAPAGEKGVRAGIKVLLPPARAGAPKRSGALKQAQGTKAKKGRKGKTLAFAVPLAGTRANSTSPNRSAP